MTRKQKTGFEPSSECADALRRITGLAHRLAAMLAEEGLSPDGQADGSRGAPLAMAMMYFLLRIPQEDLRALFLADGSLREMAFRPFPAGFVKASPLPQSPPF